MMRKAQGALEYLIIIAAVLAIAAIVVLFLTGAFKSPLSSATYSACKQQTSACSMKLSTGATQINCQADCMTACTNTKGNDAVATTIPVTAAACAVGGAGTATGCSKCTTGVTTGW